MTAPAAPLPELLQTPQQVIRCVLWWLPFDKEIDVKQHATNFYEENQMLFSHVMVFLGHSVGFENEEITLESQTCLTTNQCDNEISNRPSAKSEMKANQLWRIIREAGRDK